MIHLIEEVKVFEVKCEYLFDNQCDIVVVVADIFL
jgi:hypothetical protein